MDIHFGQTTEADFAETVNLTREVFWDVYKPGCDEHLVLKQLRESDCYIPHLDLIAWLGDRIIGHIICTRAMVINDTKTSHPVFCAGPFSIMNQYQRKGYGLGLMKYCIAKARESGFGAIILFGNPDYYHRFGFRNAEEFGITTKEGMNFEPFMALELQPGSLNGIQGKFFESEAFTVEPDALTEFEKQFPFKEKHVTPTQLNFEGFK